MNAQDWNYIAEGGAHAIFEYKYNPTNTSCNHTTKTSDTTTSSNEDKSLSLFSNQVLRIKKCDLTKAFLLHSNHYEDEYPRNYESKSTVNVIGHTNNDNVSKPRSLAGHLCNNRHESFQYSFVCEVLRGFIDVPIQMDISFDFVCELYIKTMKEHTSIRNNTRIPPSRLKDWSIPQYNKYKHKFNQHDIDGTIHSNTNGNKTMNCSPSCVIQAFLQPNYRHYGQYHEHNSTTISKTLSIEIKPKAGYIPYSPLIHPMNRVKFFHTRFELLQQLYSKGIISKGWSSLSSSSSSPTTSMRRMSYYNPMDLFSDELVDKKHAMKELFSCPQNNLKVFYDNILLYGEKNKEEDGQKNDGLLSETMSSSSSITTAKIHSVLKDVFHNNNNKNFFDDENDNGNQDSSSLNLVLQNKIQDLICNILQKHSNSLLHNLQLLQKRLDVLDYDGVIIIYQHLVDLCDGSMEDADTLVDSNSLLDGKSVKEAATYFFQESMKHTVNVNDDMDHTATTSNSIHQYLGSGSDQVALFLKLCDEVETRLTEYNSIDNMDSNDNDHEILIEEADRWYNSAMEIVKKFDKNDCVGLLQSWLMSLMMCDISFIITVCRITDNSTDLNYPSNEEDCLRNLDGNNSNDSEWNRLSSTPSSDLRILTKDGCLFQYRIKIIDLDGKPAKKLRNRDKMERKISLFQSSIFTNK